MKPRSGLLLVLSLGLFTLCLVVYQFQTISHTTNELAGTLLLPQIARLQELRISLETGMGLGKSLEFYHGLEQRLQALCDEDPVLERALVMTSDYRNLANSHNNYTAPHASSHRLPHGEFSDQRDDSVRWRLFFSLERGELAVPLHNESGQLKGTLRADFPLRSLDEQMAGIYHYSALQLPIGGAIGLVILSFSYILITRSNDCRHRLRVPIRLTITMGSVLAAIMIIHAGLYSAHVDQRLEQEHRDYASMISLHIQDDFARLADHNLDMDNVRGLDAYLERQLRVFPDLRGMAVIDADGILIQGAGELTKSGQGSTTRLTLESDAGHLLVRLPHNGARQQFLYISGFRDRSVLSVLFKSNLGSLIPLLMATLLFALELFLVGNGHSPIPIDPAKLPGQLRPLSDETLRFNFFLLALVVAMPMSLQVQMMSATVANSSMPLFPWDRILTSLPQGCFMLAAGMGAMLSLLFQKHLSPRTTAVMAGVAILAGAILFILPLSITGVLGACFASGLGAGLAVPIWLRLPQYAPSLEQRSRISLQLYAAFGTGTITGLLAGGLLADLGGFQMTFVAVALMVILHLSMALRLLPGTPVAPAGQPAFPALRHPLLWQSAVVLVLVLVYPLLLPLHLSSLAWPNAQIAWVMALYFFLIQGSPMLSASIHPNPRRLCQIYRMKLFSFFLLAMMSLQAETWVLLPGGLAMILCGRLITRQLKPTMIPGFTSLFRPPHPYAAILPIAAIIFLPVLSGLASVIADHGFMFATGSFLAIAVSAASHLAESTKADRF